QPPPPRARPRPGPAVEADRRPAVGIARRLPVDTLAVPDLAHALLAGFDLRETFHYLDVPPAGLEPTHPAPEAGALSAELRRQDVLRRLTSAAVGGEHTRLPRPARLA